MVIVLPTILPFYPAIRVCGCYTFNLYIIIFKDNGNSLTSSIRTLHGISELFCIRRHFYCSICKLAKYITCITISSPSSFYICKLLSPPTNEMLSPLITYLRSVFTLSATKVYEVAESFFLRNFVAYIFVDSV